MRLTNCHRANRWNRLSLPRNWHPVKLKRPQSDILRVRLVTFFHNFKVTGAIFSLSKHIIKGSWHLLKRWVLCPCPQGTPAVMHAVSGRPSHDQRAALPLLTKMSPSGRKAGGTEEAESVASGWGESSKQSTEDRRIGWNTNKHFLKRKTPSKVTILNCAEKTHVSCCSHKLCEEICMASGRQRNSSPLVINENSEVSHSPIKQVMMRLAESGVAAGRPHSLPGQRENTSYTPLPQQLHFHFLLQITQNSCRANTQGQTGKQL